MWCKVLYVADLFCLHGNIRPENIIISLISSVLRLFFDFFCILVKISRLYSFIYIIKINKIKNVSSHAVPLNIKILFDRSSGVLFIGLILLRSGKPIVDDVTRR